MLIFKRYYLNVVKLWLFYGFAVFIYVFQIDVLTHLTYYRVEW